MSELKPGYYRARIYDYGIVATKNKGEPQIVITMELVTEDGSNHRVSWRQGFNNDIGLRICLETLARLGLEDGETIAQLARGKESNILDIDQEYEVKVELERDKDKADVVRPKIKFIQLIGGDDIQNRVDPSQAEALLAPLNLAASFNKIKERMPQRSRIRDDIPPPGW